MILEDLEASAVCGTRKVSWPSPQIWYQKFFVVFNNTGQRLAGWRAALLRWSSGPWHTAGWAWASSWAWEYNGPTASQAVSGSTARRSRKVITSPCSARVGVDLEHSLQLWASTVSMGWSTSPMRGARLGKGMALGTPNSSLPTPLGAYEKTGPGCSQWCLAEGRWWWTEIETTEVQTGHKEKLFQQQDN